MLVNIIVKLNLTINVKKNTRVIQNMRCGTFVNGWVPNLSETRNLRQIFQPTMFSAICLFLVPTNHKTWKEFFCKTSIQRTMSYKIIMIIYNVIVSAYGYIIIFYDHYILCFNYI